MPVYNYFTYNGIGNINAGPDLLRFAGPLISVEISIPQALADFLNQTQQSIPAPVMGWAILDTGSFRTCVDSTTIENLGVKAVGLEQTLTPAGRKAQNTYPAHFKFPGTSIEKEFNEALGADLKEQNFKGQPIITLVGRDILADCIFIFNGQAGIFTLAH